MGKTLPYEHLEVGASEKSIQNILAFSKATKQLKLQRLPKELGELFNNQKSPHSRAFFISTHWYCAT